MIICFFFFERDFEETMTARRSRAFAFLRLKYILTIKDIVKTAWLLLYKQFFNSYFVYDLVYLRLQCQLSTVAFTYCWLIIVLTILLLSFEGLFIFELEFYKMCIPIIPKLENDKTKLKNT